MACSFNCTQGRFCTCRLRTRNGGESVNTNAPLGDFQIMPPGWALGLIAVICIFGVVLYHFRHF